MESCGFGKALNDDCHKIYFVRKKGFKDFCNLEKDYSLIFTFRSRECLLKINDFILGQTTISLELARNLKSKNLDCIPGWKFRRSCVKFLSNCDEVSDNAMECEIDGDVAFVNDDKQQLDNSLILIGVSPIKVDMILIN